MFAILFDNPRVFEGGVGALFLEGFDRLGGEIENERFIELRHKNLLFLEIGIAPPWPGWIELGGAGAV